MTCELPSLDEKSFLPQERPASLTVTNFRLSAVRRVGVAAFTARGEFSTCPSRLPQASSHPRILGLEKFGSRMIGVGHHSMSGPVVTSPHLIITQRKVGRGSIRRGSFQQRSFAPQSRFLLDRPLSATLPCKMGKSLHEIASLYSSCSPDFCSSTSRRLMLVRCGS